MHFENRIFSLLMVILITEGLEHDLHYYETLSNVDIHTRVRRSADPRPEASIHEVHFETLGRRFHLLLKHSSPLSHDFKSTVVHKNGETSEFHIDRLNFMAGRLKDDPKSNVHVQWEDGNMMASIFTDDDMFFVEPSWRFLEQSENHSMIAYRKSDMKWNPEDFIAGISREKWCGVADTEKTREKQDESFDENLRLYPVHNDYKDHTRKKRQAGMSYVGTHTNCRVAAVADYYFLKNMGRGDKRTTGEYVIGMIGRVNEIYRNTVWPDESSDITGLGFEIAELIVHEDYTGGEDNYNMAGRTNDMNDVLTMFGRDWQKFETFCVAHLFTYQQFPGKLGLAYIGSWRYTDLGGLCSPVAYMGGKKMAANTGISSYQNPGGSKALTLQATITTAHELAHNWGSEHDPDTDQCAPSYTDGGQYIMYPTAVNGYERNNRLFSPCSKLYIYKVVMKKGYDCFSQPTADTIGKGMCGNGRIDTGEQCDAGYDGDKCCDKDCKFRDKSYRCSPMNYPCCEDCKVSRSRKICIKNIDDNFDCKKESRCDGYNLDCPPPAFENDTTPCNDGGMCKKGVCLNLCESRGLEPCMCSGEDICMFCCKSPSGDCQKAEPPRFLQSGRPCGNKLCNGQGKCVELQVGLIRRLFNVIEYISIDKIAQFMKSNVVWLVFWLAVPLYIVVVCVVRKRDKNFLKKDKENVERMTNERNNLNPRSSTRVLRVTNPVFVGPRS